MNIQKMLITVLVTIVLGLTYVNINSFLSNSDQITNRDKIISNIDDLHNKVLEFHSEVQELDYIQKNNGWSYSETEYDVTIESIEFSYYNNDKMVKVIGKINDASNLDLLELFPMQVESL